MARDADAPPPVRLPDLGTRLVRASTLVRRERPAALAGAAAEEEPWPPPGHVLELAGGSDVGSPLLAFGDPRVGIFGPIVSPPPSGDDAVTLLDHVLAVATMTSFYELKRGRQGDPQFGPRP